MSSYASVCNNTVVMWPLFIEIIVNFCVKITEGKFMEHRENSGNFILARMWPPWLGAWSCLDFGQNVHPGWCICDKIYCNLWNFYFRGRSHWALSDSDVKILEMSPNAIAQWFQFLFLNAQIAILPEKFLNFGPWLQGPKNGWICRCWQVFIIFLPFSNPLTGLVLEILTTVMADWVVFNIAGVAGGDIVFWHEGSLISVQCKFLENTGGEMFGAD